MQSRSISRPGRGFTLLEILISLGILTTLAGAGLVMSVGTLQNVFVRADRDLVVDALASARSRAMANYYRRAWGVCYDGTQYVLFASKYGMDHANDERIDASADVQVTSMDDEFSCAAGGVVFSQLSGTTTNSHIYLSKHGSTTVIATNYEGTILW